MKQSSVKYLKKILQIVVYLAVFYFIGKILLKNWSEVRQTIEKINYIWLILSVVIITLNFTFQSYVWHRLLKTTQKTILFRESFSSYFKSTITRYLPGGVAVFFVRTYITAKLGFNKSQVLFFILIESALSILSAGLIFITIRPATNYLLLITLLLSLTALASLAILLIPKYFVSLFNTIFRKQISIISLPIKNISILIILSFIQWLIIGSGLFSLIRAFVPLSINQIPSLAAIFAASWEIGFLLLIVPSGIGIRETVLIILLGPVTGFAQATIIAILFRITYIIGETINFFLSIYLVYSNAHNKKYKSS